jgi:hypothetical protein
LKTSKEMQKLIVELCREKKCNLSSDGAYLKLVLDPYHLPLIVKRLTEWTVSVRHEFIADTGEVAPNPEVVFYTGFLEWVPIEINGPNCTAIRPGYIGSTIEVCELNSSGKYIKAVNDYAEQKNLATFVKSWFNCLKADGWGDFASDAAYKQGKLDDVAVEETRSEDESHMVEGQVINYNQLPAGSAILVGGASD